MDFESTDFKDLILCKPRVFKDARGYFYESYNQLEFKNFAGFAPNFIQDNQSQSSYGVLRGLHFQRGVNAQAKLVRVIEGEVLDVAVDLRKDQPTYGRYFSTVLSGENQKQLFVPRGMAHGFITLSEHAVLVYKCDNRYHKASERVLAYNDATLQIDWRLPQDKHILSVRDRDGLSFHDLEKEGTF